MQILDQEDRCDTESNKSIIHQCESCPCTASLKELFDQESTDMKVMKSLVTVSRTLRIDQY